MTTVKIDEATGHQLHWLLATSMGHKPYFKVRPGKSVESIWLDDFNMLLYTTSWNQMGHIIDRLDIQLMNDPMCLKGPHQASIRQSPFPIGYGKTKLEAAVRCAVKNHYGEEAEVPNELA